MLTAASILSHLNSLNAVRRSPSDACSPRAWLMERTGVSATEAAGVDGGLAWLEARTKCIYCRHVGKCCNWLEGSDPRSTLADFCLNSEFFSSCAELSVKVS